MYYVLETEILVWKRRELIAELQGEMSSYQPHWWDCVPLITQMPQLTFAIRAKAPIPDNYWNGDIISLYSQRLIEQIRTFGVTFEVFPARLVDHKTLESLQCAFSVFHLLEVHEALDLDQSIISNGRTKRIVLTSACLRKQAPLFRVKERRNIVLIHQEIKSAFELIGITGFTYTPVSEYHTTL